ncbi:MAG: UpxY family transcription antiterminator [Melioribacteraceae bacterium]|nr:UpxY family transcription antiterminator [Melioribacteraceae bacterium]
MEKTLDKHWYALYTKPRSEYKALSDLREKEIETYLPEITTIKQWSDRKKKVTEPLFRGYIFIFADEMERYSSLQSSSIVKTICFAGKPAVIPNEQIENLKLFLENKPKALVTDLIEVGSKVEITSGPFAGVEGIVFKNENKEDILSVSIDLLRRSVIVKLPAASVLKKK